MRKLFSPSMSRRKSPPHSEAKVMYLAEYSAVCQFRGKTIVANVLDRNEDDPVTVGESLRVIEHPRGVFHVRRTGQSWYANQLENWVKKGLKANAALEYFLRKNPKWYPGVIDEDGNLKLKKEMDDDEWAFGRAGGGLLIGNKAQSGAGGGSADDQYNSALPVWITCTPTWRSTSGVVTIKWGSKGEASVTITGSNGETFSGTSGEENVTITKTTLFRAVGASGAADCAFSIVSSVFNSFSPEWMVAKSQDLPAEVQIADYDWWEHLNVPGSSIGFDFYFGAGTYTILPITINGWSKAQTIYHDLTDRTGVSSAQTYSISPSEVPGSIEIDEYKKMVAWYDAGEYHRRKIALALNEDLTAVIPTPATITE